jgi:predicted AAA+ superfamily ATPase
MSDDALSRIAEALERLRPPPAKAPDWTAAEAFVWHADPDRLEPVARVNRVDLPLLLGIDRSRDTLLQNTRQFARGLPANNALLWGARGMGKSSLVKAVHGAVAAEAPGLVLVEMQREDLPSIGRLLHLLRDAPVRVILFCDDLSFSHDDQHYKSLKAVLDGGVEGRPDNVVFYATSNRRHLMPRDMIENERSTAISPSEATEEKVSLSDRFGLWLGFHPLRAGRIPRHDRRLLRGLRGGGDARDPAGGGHRMAGDARGAVGPGGVAVLHRPRRAPRRPHVADPAAQPGLHSPCLAFGSGQAARVRGCRAIRAAAAAMTRAARRSISPVPERRDGRDHRHDGRDRGRVGAVSPASSGHSSVGVQVMFRMGRRVQHQVAGETPRRVPAVVRADGFQPPEGRGRRVRP